jgi:pyruvate dehydrogenase E2 component (dihydrolipoamide acetyltransferase)
MPVEIIMPKFGFTLESCEIVQWLKQEGDAVRSGDPICEVTTDKVNMEVEAPENGTLYGLRYKAGDVVPVTDIIAYVLRPGEAAPTIPTPASTQPTPSASAIPEPVSTITLGNGSVTASPVAQRMAEQVGIDLSQVQGTGPKQRITRRDIESAIPAQAASSSKIRATPAARHLAEQQGVDLALVTGSGPKGRIQAHDVQAVAELTSQAIAPAAVQMAESTPDLAAEQPPGYAEPRIIKIEGMRRTIANRLQKSFQTAPHIFFEAQVDTTGMDGLRARLKARQEKLSITAIVVKAAASVLLRHPYMNATTDGEHISLWPHANIGVAVALEAGLVVPVVHEADSRSLRDIQTQVDNLAVRARSNSLKVTDMTDGTFTISNLGMFGVDRFTAIINPPQVGILAVGRTMQQFVPDENGQPLLRSFMHITLSADHRVVDGAVAANFIQDLRTVLEDPALLAW